MDCSLRQILGHGFWLFEWSRVVHNAACLNKGISCKRQPMTWTYFYYTVILDTFSFLPEASYITPINKCGQWDLTQYSAVVWCRLQYVHIHMDSAPTQQCLYGKIHNKNRIRIHFGFFPTSTSNLPYRPCHTTISASYSNNDIMTPLILVEDQMLKEGYPAYTTSCAWLGYSDEQLTQVCVFWSLTNEKHCRIKNVCMHM